MSLNQITQPETYIPATHLYDCKIDRSELTQTILPVSFQSTFGNTPSYKSAFFVDGANMALKLQGRLAGSGSYIQLESPLGDQDLRLAVTTLGECLLACKSNLQLTNETFTPSLDLNKTAGEGIKIYNPNITAYSPQNLDAYSYDTFNGVLVGFVPAQNCIVQAIRIGNLVNLTIDGVSSTTTGGVISFTTNILTEPYRPVLAVEGSIPTTSAGGVVKSGVVEVLPSGNITFEYQPDVLFPAGTAGWNRFSFSYTVL